MQERLLIYQKGKMNRKDVYNMENLTKSEAIELHRRMWLWIADETLIRKRKVTEQDYFKEMGIYNKDIPPWRSCYCCEYNIQQKIKIKKYDWDKYGCKYCPLNWNSKCDRRMCRNKNKLDDYKGLMGKWADKKNYKKAAKLAKKIANLPEK